jgi:hypothetical protein
VSWNFLILFFYESVSPHPQSIPLRPFRIFSKIREVIPFMIEDFLHLPPVSLIPVVNLELRIYGIREFSEKFETALIVHSGAWVKLIHEKTRIQKSRDTVP